MNRIVVETDRCIVERLDEASHVEKILDRQHFIAGMHGKLRNTDIDTRQGNLTVGDVA